MGSTDRVRVVLVGCGGIGLRHLRGYAALSSSTTEVELVGVCDLDEQQRAHAAEVYRAATGRAIEQYSSLAQIPAASVDAVDVAVGTWLHPAVCEEAFDRGWHVMVEKPIALTVPEADRMAAAARSAGRVLAVAENFRRIVGNRALKYALDDGLIGQPYLTTSVLSLPARDLHPSGGGDWYRDRRRSGSLVALEMGVHEMDLLRYWFGPIRAVSGAVRAMESSARSSTGEMIAVSSEDTCTAVVTFEAPVLASVSLTMAGHGEPLAARTVVGSLGSVTSDCWEAWQGGALTRDGAAPVPWLDHVRAWLRELDPHTRERLLPPGTWDPDRLETEVSDPVRYGIAHEILDFARAITDARAPEVGHPEATAALAAGIALLESSMTGREVRVDDVLSGDAHHWQDSLEHPQEKEALS